MSLLEYPLGHQHFVGYPQRWFSCVNHSVYESTSCSSDHLVSLLLDTVFEAEHLADDKLGHLLAILLWSAYRSGIRSLHCTLRTLFNSTSLKFALSLDDNKSPLLGSCREHIRQIRLSSYYSNCKYLQIVIDLLIILVDKTADTGRHCNLKHIVEWRFGTLPWLVLSLSHKLFIEEKYSLTLDSLFEFNKTCKNIPVLKQLASWNIAAVLDRLNMSSQCVEILELCTETFVSASDSPNSPVGQNCATLDGFFQQLALRNFKAKRLSQCKKYCSALKEMDLKRFQPPTLEYCSAVYKSDLAYLTDDLTTQRELLDTLQSFDALDILDENSSDILDENSSDNGRRLATCCLLLTQSRLQLDRGNLQRSYEYFVLSYQQSRRDLECRDSLWFDNVKDRYLAQLHSLEGYFLVLQGEFESAAFAYSVSYSHDNNLVMSLYNYCLLLLKQGKGAEAKKNWKSAHLGCSDHCFSKFGLFLSKVG